MEQPRFLSAVVSGLYEQGSAALPAQVVDAVRAHCLLLDFLLEEGVEVDEKALHPPTAFGEELGAGSDPYNLCPALAVLQWKPFAAGNVATAFLCALHCLRLAARQKAVHQREVERLFGDAAASGELSISQLTEALVGLSVPVEKRSRKQNALTVRTRLELRGFGLEDPSGGRIHVVRWYRAGLFGWGGKRRPRSLGKLGFAGWTRIMEKKDIKEIRRLTGLTPKRGVDHDAFHGPIDYLPMLINDNAASLKRLFANGP